MSYRTSVNNTQIFGNNEYYIEWENFIKSQGIEIDDEGCYDGEITDVMGMFNTIDKITKRLIEERHLKVLNGETDYEGKTLPELTDLSDSAWLKDNIPIFMFNKQIVENAYCFLPYQVYLAVEDVIERTSEVYKKDDIEWFCCTYKLKDGEKIRVHAS